MPPPSRRGGRSALYAVIAVLVVVVLVLAVLYVTKPTAPSKTTTSSVAVVNMPVYSAVYPGVLNLSKEFMNANPGIKVTLTSYSYDDLQTQEFDAIATHSSQWSVFMWDCIWAGTMATATYRWNVLEADYPSVWAQYSHVDSPNNTFPLQQEAYDTTPSGQTFGLVWNANVQTLFYNASLFSNATIQNEFKTMFGFPLPNPVDGMNLTVFQDVANFFTKSYNSNSPTQYGVALMNRGHDIFYEFLNFFAPFRMSPQGIAEYGQPPYSYFTYFGSVNGTVVPAVNGTIGLQALEYYGNISKDAPAPVTTGYGEAQSYFTSGTTAMLLGWGLQGIPIISQIGMKNFGIAPVPGGWPDDGVWSIGVNQYAANPEAAWKWVLFLTSPSSEEYLWNTTSSVPGNVTAANSLVSAYPWLQIALNSLEGHGTGIYGAAHRPTIPQLLQLEYGMTEYFDEYLTGTISAQTAISDLVVSWDTALAG